jgi:TonB-linked SusC/RagA family outer membrane protein
MRKIALLMVLACTMALQLWAQNRTVTGKVTDSKGQPLPGVSVTARGQKVGTQTDANGIFSISLPENVKQLEISSVGFVSRNVAVGAGGNLAISLEEAKTSDLSEVTVVAYGTQKKPEITGAIAKVGAADIENRPFTSVDRALQGQVAGLQSVAASGQPGASQDIRIRGFSSITASNSPLWVVDGVPINTGDASRLATTGNLLSTLNPNDIESVSVLKDASATAVYGSRGANGVILVTTKQGRTGKTRFKIDTEAGFSEIAYQNNLYKPLNAAQYFELTREGLINAGIANAGNVDAVMTSNFGFGNGADFNWLDNTSRRGTQQSISASASGGSDKTSFYLSGSYFRQEGIVVQSDFKRYSAALNVKHRVNDKFVISTQLNAGIVDQIAPLNGGAFGNPVLSSFFLLPSRNAYNANGSYNITAPDFGPGALFNTLYIADVDKRKLAQNSIRGNVSGEYNILKNLKFTTRYGADYNVLEEDQYNNPFHGDGQAASGRAFFYYTRYYNWTWTNILDYRYNITKNKDFYADLKVGYEAQKSTGVLSNVQSQGFPPNLDLIVPSVGATPIQSTRTGTDFAFNSAFSILNLNYKDRYAVSASFRRDGSSRFGSNNQFGNFWSVGGTWNIDQESFMQDVRWVSQLKLRGSYGVNGNAGIGNYDWRPLYGYGANYNQTTGSTPTNPGNVDLTWELNKQFNVGFDFGLFKNRFTGTVDYYDRKSEDLLLNEPLSPTSGFTTVTRNVGSMYNRGVEVTVNVAPIQTKDFRWNINFNIAFNKNRVTAISAGQPQILAGVFTRRPGYDFQTYFARLWAGVDPANGDPLWYTDSTKKTTTNNYNLAARTATFGTATPKFFGGFTNTFTFKGLSIEAQFNYSGGNYLRDTWGGFYNGSGNGGAFNKVVRQYEQRWRTPGVASEMPRYVYNGNRLAQSFSTFYLYKGDYIRLRDLTVGYDFPRALLEKIKLTSLRIYGRGTNIWTKVKDSNVPFDPEQGVSNETNLNVYIPATYTFGLNIGF